MIEEPGTINFWVDPKRNPGAFTEGVNYNWIEFQLGTDMCKIVSKGASLIALLNPNTENEMEIFNVIPEFDNKDSHMITLTWTTDEMTLYFDAKVLHVLKVNQI